VECAPWVDVDTVRVVRARDLETVSRARDVRGRDMETVSRAGDALVPGGAAGANGAHPEEVRSVRLAPAAHGAGAARTVDVSFALRFDEDDAFFVVASGERPMSPVLGGDAKETLPWAMTGAIWVDADGDGKSLGR
jgi:hypothetical protein